MVRQLVIFVFILACSCTTAMASFSALATIPSCDVASSGEMSLSLLGEYSAGESTSGLGLCIGGRGYEFGGEIDNSSREVAGHFKFMLRDSVQHGSGMAVGMTQLSRSRDSALNQAYLVMDWQPGENRYTVGVSRQTGPAADRDRSQFLIGWDRSLSGGWWTSLDFSSGKSELGGVGYAISKYMSQGHSLQVTCFRPNERSQPLVWSLQHTLDF